MKCFLPLFMLTGLLFGQDVLTLKNGESYKGTYIGKVGEDIVFKVPLTSSVSSIFLKRITNTKKFPIWSVETIVTKNGELTYPFDIPIKELSKQDIKYDPDTGEPIMPQEVKYDPDTGEPIMPQVYSAKGQDVLYLKSGESYGGTFIRKVDKDIVFKVEGEKRSTNFPINDVYGIETKYYGELYYPFDVPSEKEIYKQERQAPDDILNRLSDGWNSLSFKYKIYCLYFLLMAWMSLTSPY